MSIIQVYAPQQGRPQEEKEDFYVKLQEVKDSVPYPENIIIIGDLNGHTGIDRTGIENILGAFGIGEKKLGRRTHHRFLSTKPDVHNEHILQASGKSQMDVVSMEFCA